MDKNKLKSKLKFNFNLKSINSYYWWWVAALVCIILVVTLGSYWFATPSNHFVGVIVALLAVVSFVLIRRQIKHRHDIKFREVAVNIDTNGVKGKVEVKDNGNLPNSLNIYAYKDKDEEDKVYPLKLAFENVYEPAGQPQRCLNDNKDYFVNISDVGTKKLKPFILPDSRYTDPSIMARYLNLPAQRKYLRHRESLMKYIGPGLLLVANIGAFIAIIALGGG